MKLLTFGLVLVALPAGALEESVALPPMATLMTAIDQVALEPTEGPPERIQIRGAFVVMNLDSYRYEAPVRGFTYFGIRKGREEACRREWNDLKSVAGSGQCVSIGSHYESTRFRVRKGVEAAKDPDAYPMGTGVTKLLETHPQARLLRMMPAPVGPADGREAAAGKVTLAARNILDTKLAVKYMFEIESGSGEKEASPAVEPGEKETKWSPRMEAKAGEKYTWRVWVMEGEKKGPVAIATFTGTATK